MAKNKKSIIFENSDVFNIIIYYIIIFMWFLYSWFYGDVFNVFEPVIAIIAFLLPITNYYIFDKKTLDKNKLLFKWLKVCLSFILFIIVGCKIYLSYNFPIFDKNGKDFKVLVLPFKQICQVEGKSYDAGYVINEKLKNINVNLKSFYYNNFDVTNLTSEKIDSLQDKHNSDMVIFGSLISEDCSKVGDQICLKFKLKDSTLLGSESETTKSEFVRGGLDDLLHGKIQNKIENITLVLSIIVQLKNAKDDELSDYLDEIFKTMDFEEPENSLIMMGDLLYSLGYIGAASKLYTQIGSFDGKDTISWNSFDAIIKSNKIFEEFGFREKTSKEIESFISGVKKNYILLKGQDSTTEERFIFTYITAGYDYIKIKEYKKAKNCFDNANMFLLKYNNRENLIHKIEIIHGLAVSYINLGNNLEARMELNKLINFSSISLSEPEFIQLTKGFLLSTQLNLEENNFDGAKDNLEKVGLNIRDSKGSLGSSIHFIKLEISYYIMLHNYFLKINQKTKGIKPLNLAIEAQLNLLSLDSLNLINYYQLEELYELFAKYYQNDFVKQEYYWKLSVDIYEKILKNYQGFYDIEFSYVELLYNLAATKFELYKDLEALELLKKAKRILQNIKSKGSQNLSKHDIEKVELLIDNLNRELLKK